MLEILYITKLIALACLIIKGFKMVLNIIIMMVFPVVYVGALCWKYNKCGRGK